MINFQSNLNDQAYDQNDEINMNPSTPMISLRVISLDHIPIPQEFKEKLPPTDHPKPNPNPRKLSISIIDNSNSQEK